MLRSLFFGLPVLMVVLGIPLALKLVPPNRFYGYRTPTSFSSSEAWYQINFATGVAMIAAGLVAGAAVVLLSQGIIALKPEGRYLVGVLVTGVLMIASLIPVVVYANRF